MKQLLVVLLITIGAASSGAQDLRPDLKISVWGRIPLADAAQTGPVFFSRRSRACRSIWHGRSRNSFLSFR